MLLDCVELPSASTRRNTSAVPLPVDPVDEEPSISSGPNRSNATATASLSSTSAGNARPVSSKQPGPDLGSLANLSPEQLDSAPTTTRQPVQGVPGLMQTVDRNGKVVMDFSQVRNRTWFDMDRARRQRQAQELAAQPSGPPVASTSQRQLTPVADEDVDFPWDAREERINELSWQSDRTPRNRRPSRLPPSSPPQTSPPAVLSPAVEPNLPHVSSPVQGEDDFEDDPETEPVEKGKGKSVAFIDNSDEGHSNDDLDDDGASDNYSDDFRQKEKLPPEAVILLQKFLTKYRHGFCKSPRQRLTSV
ncbi:hypothetical protein VKT23_019743 [Stygiomarasmius scandens]|uniref:Uncharacterized protein n=1 Tax=Marasmiellus scandens TaxID=2682957 RepID=A0ABR1IKZ1_9AGAR